MYLPDHLVVECGESGEALLVMSVLIRGIMAGNILPGGMYLARSMPRVQQLHARNARISIDGKTQISLFRRSSRAVVAEGATKGALERDGLA
jgi:hypothetical protein